MFVRIFDRYIGRQVWSGTLTGVLVLSVLFVLGTVFKKLDQLVGDTDLPVSVIARFFALIIPFSLIFTLPWAFLTSILLVFGRMSADNELVSIRMTGSSMWRICVPVFTIGLLLTGVCYWVNIELAPDAKNKTKRLFYDVVMDDPASLFQPGRVLDRFPGYRIYTGKRKDDVLQDVVITELDGSWAKRTIRAKKAQMQFTPGVLDFVLKLTDASIEVPSEGEGLAYANVEFIRFKETEITFPLSRLKEKTERVAANMKSTPDLWSEVRSGISTVNQQPLDEAGMSSSRTELSKRYSLSLVCAVFMFVGIPLGVTAQRRETSIGFLLSLVTAVAYYAFIIFGEQMSEKPSALPHLVMWAPSVLFLGVGCILFYRLSRK